MKASGVMRWMPSSTPGAHVVAEHVGITPLARLLSMNSQEEPEKFGMLVLSAKRQEHGRPRVGPVSAPSSRIGHADVCYLEIEMSSLSSMPTAGSAVMATFPARSASRYHPS
jgi:hypothetical protein